MALRVAGRGGGSRSWSLLRVFGVMSVHFSLSPLPLLAAYQARNRSQRPRGGTSPPLPRPSLDLTALTNAKHGRESGGGVVHRSKAVLSEQASGASCASDGGGTIREESHRQKCMNDSGDSCVGGCVHGVSVKAGACHAAKSKKGHTAVHRVRLPLPSHNHLATRLPTRILRRTAPKCHHPRAPPRPFFKYSPVSEVSLLPRLCPVKFDGRREGRTAGERAQRGN